MLSGREHVMGPVKRSTLCPLDGVLVGFQGCLTPPGQEVEGGDVLDR